MGQNWPPGAAGVKTKVVFRLITFFASTVCLAVVVWLGLTVELGERTLFGHLRAISGSREAEQLLEGARTKVTEVVGIEAAKRAERLKAEAEKGKGKDRDGRSDEPPGTAPAGPPQEEVGESDRQGLRRIIDSKKPPAGQARAVTPAKKPPPPVKGRVPPPASRPPSKS